MKMNPKFHMLMSVFCWLGTALVAFLEVYMLRMLRSFPEIDSFRRNAWLIAPLLLLWLAAAVWFTVQAKRDRQDKKK